MADFLARRWRRQPTGAVVLDFSNPLLRDVRFVGALLNGNAWDAFRNRRGTYSGSAVPSVNALAQETAAFVEQSTISSVDFASSNDTNVTGEVTLLYRFLYTSASSSGAHFGKNTSNGTTATPFGFDFTPSLGRSIRSNTDFRYHDSATGFAHNVLNTALVAAPADIAVAPRFFRNGVKLGLGASVGSGSGAATTNSNPVKMGARIDATIRQTGFANLGIVWSRQLTDGEAAEITYAPWQIFKPLRARVYSLPSTLTFNPSWAAGSNQYLGGGLYA